MRRLATTLLLLLATSAFATAAWPASDVLFPIDDGAPAGCATGRGTHAVALDADGPEVPLDQTVVIAPPRVEAERPLAGGATFTCTLTIRSRRDETATFQLEPFGIVGSRSGSAGFEFVDADDERFDQTAGPWIEPAVEEVTLEPRGVAKVPVTVTVPDDPAIGAAYGSVDVVSRTRASAGETAVGIETHVTMVFLLRVGGDGAPELHLRDVDAPRLRWSREPWPLTADLDNDGTLHADARGRVRVRSIFGNSVATLPVDRETVLPGGREAIDVRWRGVPWLGFYRWDLRIEDDAGSDVDGAVARTSGWFVALPPWWALALVAIVVLGALVGAWRQRRGVDEAWSDDELDQLDDA